MCNGKDMEIIYCADGRIIIRTMQAKRNSCNSDNKRYNKYNNS